jgi:hypothetical protein
MDTVTAHLSRRCRPIIASAVLVAGLLLAVTAHIPAASGSETAVVEFTQERTIAHRAGIRPSYGWPVKPFNRQHPVRANLNDPRNGHGDTKSFHFGIDVSAPNGSAVYAVEGGEVFLSGRRMAVAVKGATRTFGYWHVVPAVRNHQIVRVHQLLGYICDEGGGRHVHLAERRNDEYLNPLRPGGIGPYVDRTPPTLASVEFRGKGRVLAPDALTGRVKIVVEAFDTTPIIVPKPWSNLPVTPARIRWSITHGSRSIRAPRTAADFSRRMLSPKLYDSIYAPGTLQNYVGAPGHYRFYLAHGLDASRLPAGRSQLRIEAVDTRGNRVVAQVGISAAGR